MRSGHRAALPLPEPSSPEAPEGEADDTEQPELPAEGTE